MMPTVAKARCGVCAAISVPIEAMSHDPKSAVPTIGKTWSQLSDAYPPKSSTANALPMNSSICGSNVMASIAVVIAASLPSA